MLLRCPGFLLALCLEVGVRPLWQEDAPRGIECLERGVPAFSTIQR
jgi:hypothetical protein